ncbi:MAG: ankyrin repeat domain-containing protein [Gammaproteobacteria bacterium]
MKCFAAIVLLATAATAQADSPLADAIKAGDRRAALEMLSKGVDVNAAQPDGTTALHWASYQVDADLVKQLIAKGAKADVRNNFGATPLAEAVKVGNAPLVKMLLDAGANANAANEDDQTPLMLAARTGVVEIADLLLRHKANVNAVEKWRGQNALMWAASDNFPDMTEFLIKHGANVKTRATINDWGSQITSEPRAQYRPTGGLTPLLYAARAGCDRCILAMLKAGADVNLPTPEGVTPLMVAIDNQHYDTAKLLMRKGANPHTWDWYGRTPLYVAVDVRTLRARVGGGFGNGGGERERIRADKEGTTSVDILNMLLDAGVDRNPQLNMHRPGRGGNSGRFVEDLLTAGATPLLRAAVTYDEEAIKILLDHGALVDLPNAMGVTAFMTAAGVGVSIRDPRADLYTAPDAQKHSIATMEVLLMAGADVNARMIDTSGHTARIARPSTVTSRQGQTAIYGAINWGWTDVVQYLLDHGARVDIADAQGKTPIDATKGNAGGRDFKKVDEIVALIQKATTAQGGKPLSASAVNGAAH